MTYKQIESSRNRRLWITQVGLPIAGIVTTAIAAFPEARGAIVNKTRSIKDSIKSKIAKKEKSTTEKRVVVRVDAENLDEALGALEAMAKELMTNKEHTGKVKKSIQTSKSRKA